MATINTTDELLALLRENEEFRDAVMREVLTEDLIRLPDEFSSVAERGEVTQQVIKEMVDIQNRTVEHLADVQKTQIEMSERQNTLVETQNGMLERQNTLAETQNRILETQNTLAETQNRMSERQNTLVETQNTRGYVNRCVNKIRRRPSQSSC